MLDDHRPRNEKTIAIVSSLAFSLVNFRLELMKSMVAHGHTVRAFAPDIDAATRDILSGIDVSFTEIPMTRTGINPLQDIKTVSRLVRELSTFAPDVILSYTMKPIIYANMAARQTGVSKRFALFTGLGYSFSEESPKGKRAAVRAIAVQLYRHALKGIDAAFVYNEAEEADLRRFGLVAPSVPVIRVPGSGIDTNHFAQHTVPSGKVRFLMISRLLKSKGIDIYVQASRQLRSMGVDVEVQLLGPLDSNPDACTQADVTAWKKTGILNYLGETKDVRPFIRNATVIVLPAKHREGMPRSVLEGLSIGRSIITTDVPGCVDSIVSGEHGFIVPAEDPNALALAMKRFVDDPELAQKMGNAARKYAESTHDVHKVNRLLLSHMGLLEDVDKF